MLILIAQYDAHLRRQEADLRLFSEDESLILNPNINYATIEGLSSEVRERLSAVRPTTIVRSHPTTYFSYHLSKLSRALQGEWKE